MANKLIVFAVFATVAQASFAADVEEDREITLESWYEAVDSLYNTISNLSVALADGQAEYVALATKGREAFLDAAPQGKNQTLLDQLSVYGKTELCLIFEAIVLARYATSDNLTSTITELEENRNKMPLTPGVALDFELAGSSTSSQSDGVAAINAAFDGYYKAIAALAKYAAGQTTEVDTSSKTPAQNALACYIDMIYDLIVCE